MSRNHHYLLLLAVIGSALAAAAWPSSGDATHGGCGPYACGVRNNIWASRWSGAAPLTITIGGDAWASNYSGGFSMRLHCQTGPSTRRCRNSTSCSTSCSYNPSTTTSYHIRHNAYVEGHDGDDAYKDSSGGWITVSAVPPPPPRVPSWSVTASANPASGLVPLTSAITGVGTGAAIGGIRWQVDCTDDGVWDTDVTNTNTTYSVSCTYPGGGTFTARVRSTREGLLREATAAVAVSSPPVGAVDPVVGGAAGTCATGLTGWARDEDDTGVSLLYEVYRDGFRGICPGCLVGSGIANEPGNGPGDHRFTTPIPPGQPAFNGNAHSYYVYAKDSALPSWQLLNPGGAQVTCFELPVVTLTSLPSTPPSIPNGGTALIRWQVANPGGVTCDATGGTAPWQGTNVGTMGTVNSGPLPASTTFTITCTNPAGSTTANLLVVVDPPPDPVISGEQFCTSFGGTITWTYGGPIEDYRLQVATDAGFSAVVFDSGWVNAPGSLSGNVQDPAVGPGGTYYSRVKVRDAMMVESGWSTARQFVHPPRVVIALDPNVPIEDQPFDAIDDSTYGSASPVLQLWDFGDGSPLQNGSPVTHTYSGSGASTVTLTVRDTNYPSSPECSGTLSLRVNRPIPGFKEVLPQ